MSRERLSSSSPRLPSPSKPLDSPPLPFGDLIEKVDRNSLKAPSDVTRAEITDTALVSSYSWIAGSSPKIMVPGNPPRWTPLPGLTQLRPDSGEYYRDINSASYPRHPLEPAIVSIMKMKPESMPVNIVACSSTIANLLRFSGASKLDHQIRILVEMVGDSVHFIRRENSPKEVIPGIHGYGHAFRNAYTTLDEDIKQSYSHQNIIRYRFGGLHLMVRFEADGFIDTPKKGRRATPAVPAASRDTDSLCSLSNLGIGDPALGSRDDAAELELVQGGVMMPQETVFDLKTRSGQWASQKNPTRVLQEQIHRLWVSQSKQFIVAYHKHGQFINRDVKIMKIADDVKQWENDMQPELKRLAGLLHLILDRAQKAHDGKLELVLSPGKPLEIRKQASASNELLSPSVRKDWAAWLGASGHDGKGHDEKGHDLKGHEEKSSSDEYYDNEEALDYTACDAECSYCGKCNY